MLRLAIIAALSLTRPVAGNAAASIGAVSLSIQDAARADPIKPDRRRSWRVDLYYPAKDARSGKRLSYAPDRVLLARMIADRYYDVPDATLRSWGETDGPVRWRAKPNRGNPLPLVLLSPGSGVAAFNYAMLASGIAARGYAVAVIDHPYLGLTRLADGRIVSGGDDPLQQVDDPKVWMPRVVDWARDVSVTIDRLVGERPVMAGLRIDPRRILSVGHSLGGTVAVEVCSRESRVSACADFEGAVEGTTAYAEGPRRPTLFTGSRSAKPDRPHLAPDLSKAPWLFLARGTLTSNWGAAITGGSHMSFSDAPWVMPDTLSRFGGTLMSPDRSAALYGGMVDALGRAYFPGGGGDATMAAFLASAPEVKATRSVRP